VATPQLEDGHVRIANELLEAILGFGFSQRELLVLLTIIRKTYGFNKKEDDMSASQIGEMCGLARPHVTAVLNQLAQRNVISKRQGKFGSIVGIQKNHKKWVGSDQIKGDQASTDSVQGSTESVLVPDQYRRGTDSVQVDSTDSVHTKDNLPKDIVTPKPPVGGLTLAPQAKEPKRGHALKTFLADCKAKAERPIRDYEPLWAYTRTAGLPDDFVALAWVEFCRRFGTGGVKEASTQKNWRQTFRNYVERNYLKLWAIDREGQYFLTADGKQAQKVHASKEAA
jgi:phage replication O-like protein O